MVSARRVVSAGTLKPLRRMLPSFDSSLTSGRTRIEMRPSASTLGVKARPTPYCLYSMVTEPSACEIGTGNSPPARKLAVSPESAVRFGSARIVTRPSLAARSSAPMRSRPNSLPAAPSVVAPARPVKPLLTAGVSPAAGEPKVPALPWPTPNWKPLVESRDSRLTPICLTTLRLTSAMRTLQVDLQRRRRLQAVDRDLARRRRRSTPVHQARRPRLASSGEATVPVSSTMLPTGVSA